MAESQKKQAREESPTLADQIASQLQDYEASNPAYGQQANLIRFNPPETHQPATQHRSTSAPQNLQAKTTTDSQPAASKTSQLAAHIKQNNKQNNRQKEQESSKEKPKQPNYK
jgi:hypothetical protein|uniref:Uncharacterized protein n=1 Tax=Populus trichocarpa TaxID=3694 RepID=B9N8Z0_POPTR